MRVLVIGAGKAVKEELARVDRADFDKVLSVNRAALLFAPVDVHLSLHPQEWAQRKVAWFVSFCGYRKAGKEWVDEIFDYQWPEYPANSGSSGLYAVKYAMERLGAAEVVLAGVGMDTTPHVYDNRAWKQAERFRHTWEKVAPRLTGRVTSLGGWTAQLLGQPKNQPGDGHRQSI